MVANNAIYSAGGGNGGVGCFSLDLPSAACQAVDYNVCFMNGKGEWVVGHGALSDWSSSTGFDQHSKSTDPQFKSIAAPFDLSPASGSPLIDNGDPTNSAPTDITGKQRDSHPNIGAYE